MNMQPTPPEAAFEDERTALLKANEAFERGQVNETWSLISPLIGRTDLPDPFVNKRNFLQLGCAVYYTGDLEAANELNARLPVTRDFLPLRYRLAIRQRQPRTAKWLRRSSIAEGDKRLAMDFRTSAAIWSMWNGRLRDGFRLYPNRHGAIMFPKIIPDALRYAPLPKDPKDDLPWIILEQGVGDIFFYLCHIRQQGHHNRSTFVADRKFQGLIARWFPEAKFVAFQQIPESMNGQACHCAGDFIGRGWHQSGDLLVRDRPDTPRRSVLDRPVFGICWRGGSGQNRREERHIPLQYFLDLLPKGADFLALQFDITDEEKAVLAKDGRVRLPFADITADPMVTLDMVRDLAGVISVDSANWHFAGVADVPFLAIMNKTAHWFWGPRAHAEDTYPSAQTVRKVDLSSLGIKDWMASARRRWQERPKAAPFVSPSKPAKPADFDQPVFVVSIPRSRSSMIMRALAAQGVWTGKTVGPSSANPHGFFENTELRELFVKGVLKELGSDPLGVTDLPPLFPLPPFPHLAYQFRRRIGQQGYESGAWAFKDPKLTLLWPIYARAFPQAHWVILDRPTDDIIASLCRTSFMRRHSRSPEFWRMFCIAYQERMNTLEKMLPNVLRVDVDKVAQHDFSQLSVLFERMGLSFSAEKAQAAIDQKLVGAGRGTEVQS